MPNPVQICSNLFPNIETASYELGTMKYFSKIMLKSLYNKIEIDETFKEITTINIMINLLRWTYLLFGIKPYFSKSNWKNFIDKDEKRYIGTIYV